MPGYMTMLASRSNDERHSGARTLANSRRSSWQYHVFLSRLLRMTYGLTLQPEEEPTQVEIRFRGVAHLWIRAFDHQVVRSRTGTGKVTSVCAVARPELRTTAAGSSINSRRQGMSNMRWRGPTSEWPTIQELAARKWSAVTGSGRTRGTSRVSRLWSM